MDKVVKYNVTDAKIAEMRELYKVTPDAECKEGFAVIKSGLAELRTCRTSVEKERIALKADALAWGKTVDNEAKRITAELVEIEAPMKAAKNVVDDRKAAEKAEKERLKQEHVRQITAKITAIRESSGAAAFMSVSEAERLLAQIEAMTIDEDEYEDQTGLALTTKATAVTNLRTILDTKRTQEAKAAKQAAEE